VTAMRSWKQTLEKLIRGAAAFVALAVLAGAGTACAQPAPGLANLPELKPTMDCTALANADVSAAVGAVTKITSAKISGAGDKTYCAIQGVIAPRIRFELRLPTQGWTQRYLQVGCGGLCGVLNVRTEHADGCVPVQSGAIAMASTDMGHEGKGGMAAMGDGTFGTDPQARVDFAYRGVHLTAVASKALIARFYGQAPRYNYFSGCSDGGREALMEAQRFPDDFDGIAGGAPAMYFTVQNSFYHAWQAASNTGPDGKSVLIASRLPILHAAALASCDAVDGLKDGQIDDPRACRFDPAVAQCKPGQASDTCLTPAEVATARKLYDGPVDAAGKPFTLGQPQVGSELSWAGVFVPASADQRPSSYGMAEQPVKYLLSQTNPSADYSLAADFKFTAQQFADQKWAHELYDATETDLSPFAAKGGKLILWHGWSDPHISPLGTIAYRNAVVKQMGQAEADKMLRLFVFPGLYHCFGGDGLSQFDIVSPLMAWVEAGQAPDVVLAGKVELPDFAMMGPPPAGHDVREMGPPGANRGGPPAMGDLPPLTPTRLRPVFAYTQVARYVGSGSIDAPESFVARTPTAETATRVAYAATLLQPRFHTDCVVDGTSLACKPSAKP
jgi:hypothetical protein